MNRHPVSNVNTPDATSFSDHLRDCAEILAQMGVDALGQLYDLTAPRLFRYALTLTQTREEAEDALQAAMVRVALHPRKLSKANHQWAYLLKILRNEVFKHQRKRTPSTEYREELLAIADVSRPRWETEDRKQLVHQALAKLPPEQAEVVALKVWEEMTFAEMADVLGESPNTVASRYRYAMQKLTQHLQPYTDEVCYD